MNNERLLTKLEDLVGKTITAVGNYYDEYYCLHFKGGSFCIFIGVHEYYGEGSEVGLCDDINCLNMGELCKLGIITQEERTKLEEDARVAFEALQKTEQETRDKRNKKARRTQYNRLKKEFEGK